MLPNGKSLVICFPVISHRSFLYLGLPAPARCTGGRCRCKATKAGTGRTERTEWDIYGNHLSGQCGWGGWCIKRHGDVARVLMQFLRAAGFRATDKRFNVYPACQQHTGGIKTTKRIPDIIATDQNGTTAAFDVMITHPAGRTAATHKPLHAASQGEKGKQAGYDEHKAKCRAQGSTDPGLSIPLVPLVFETYGAAGNNVQELICGVVRTYSTQILNLDDPSAVSYFHHRNAPYP